MIKRLDWDSEFFSLNVGEWQEGSHDDISEYDVIYVKTAHGIFPDIKDYERKFTEVKVVFGKRLDKEISEAKQIRRTTPGDTIQDLYDLAYESGKNSRFRLDEGFGQENFEKLYRAWIDNSLNGTFADEVLVYEDNKKIQGLVTYKKHESSAHIGLIAVAADCQGIGIGKKLLDAVEQRLVKSGIYELKIPTQLDNIGSCAFYEKQGYTVFETTFISHYWRK